MDALGRLFDIGLGWAPVDLDTSNAATGKRISLQNATGITFVVATGTGGADDLVLDVQQHTAYTGGTSADLDAITAFYIKAETALDNDESWVKITQTLASECTVVGATYGAMQKLIVIEVDAAQLDAGYTHVSLTAAVTTGTAQLSVCLYLLHDLAVQRAPVNLGNLLNPGATNA
jgi:hypothetical protein